MRRYPATSLGASFGPGPMTPAVKALLIANGATFVLMSVLRFASPASAAYVLVYLGLSPADVLESWRLWQPVTYMFLHAGVFHLLFNMLALWMFGVELERLWGTRLFARYYAITGIGAALTMLTLALLPTALGDRMYDTRTVGASGAIFGLLLAYGLQFPNRQIYMYFLFPIPAKYFVMIVGAISLYSTMVDQDGGVAHAAHLGGLAVGYVYLRKGRTDFHPIAELKYRYLKWKINRLRRRFDVYSGGRADDVDRRIH
jgi:membrane associated rhomboid family serine protease